MSKNLATTTIVSHPGPPTSATSVTVATGTGSRLFTGMAVIHPADAVPTSANAEVVSITDVTGDVVTIVRAQESSTARAIVTGDILTQGITAAMWDTLVSSNAGKAAASHVHSAADVTSGTLPLARGGTGGTAAATARTSLGLGSAATMTPATIAADPALTGTYARLAPDWITDRAYVVGELVVSGGTLYRCTTAHVSGASISLANFAALGGSGGAGLPSSFITRTASATVTVGQFVLADATSGPITQTLPTSPSMGDVVAVKKIDATANVVTVLPGAGTIDGDTDATIVSEDAGALFAWDGAAWRIAGIFTGGGGATGLLPANNLSDLTSPAAARTNLGLGALATANSVPAAVIGGGKPGDFYVWKTFWNPTGTAAFPVGWEIAVPFVLPAGRSVAAVSILVVTAATTGGVARIGWRSDDEGWPAALGGDLGTVATDSTGGKTLSVPFSPPTSTLFWITVTAQVAAGTLRAGAKWPLGEMLEGNPVASDALTAGLRGVPFNTSVTGALGAAFSARAAATTTGNGLPPYVFLTLA